MIRVVFTHIGLFIEPMSGRHIVGMQPIAIVEPDVEAVQDGENLLDLIVAQLLLPEQTRPLLRDRLFHPMQAVKRFERGH